MRAFGSFLLAGLCLLANGGEIKEITSETGSEVTYTVWGESARTYSDPWPSMQSQFGIHEFQGSITGRLVIIKGDDFLCDYKDAAGKPSAAEIPAGAKAWVDVPPSQLSGYPVILLIQRGKAKDDFLVNSCHFVHKVAIAEQLGAVAAIVWDDRDEDLFTMWDPDYDKPTQTTKINIPSILINSAHGKTLTDALTNGKWTEAEGSHAVSDLVPLTVTIRWGLPHPDGDVELDYFTCADDFKSLSFKENFPSVLTEFGNSLHFTPRYFILNGTKAGCFGKGAYCGDQCANNGRYCVQDPDTDLVNGLSGHDVIQEDVRQICVWKYQKYLADRNKEDQLAETQHWFQYVDKFNKNCLGADHHADASTFHADCSKEQMNSIDDKMWPYVENCVKGSGGVGKSDYDHPNTLLDEQLEVALRHDVFFCPQAVVNEFRLDNNWECPAPVSIDTCETFRSVCASYAHATTPDICGGSPGCPAGEYVDACHQCHRKDDPAWNTSCMDCKGELNGGATYHTCPFGTNIQVCVVTHDEASDACKKMCEYNTYDACGLCTDPKSPDYVSPDNHPLGTMVSHCGKCLSRTDQLLSIPCNRIESCERSTFDACGDCVEVGQSSWVKYETFPNAVKDCDQVCAGTKKQYCGLCMDRDDPRITMGKECDEVVSGGGSKAASDAAEGTSSQLALIVSLVCVIVLVVAFIVYFMWNRMNKQEEDFRRLMSQYTLLDEQQEGRDLA